MKQKINPVIAILLILVVFGVAGVVMYYHSEPPMVDIRPKSPEEWRRQMDAQKQGMLGMKTAIEANKPKNPSADKKHPAKPETPGNTQPDTSARQGE